MIERALGDGADEQTVAACIAKFADYYKDHYNVKTRAYGGVHRCIDMLRKNGVRVGVVTNKLHDISVALCREHFGEVFDSVIGDLPGLARKPDPSKVKSMMAEFCCEQAIMVGDSDVDIKTAKNAGIPCVALSWGFNSRERLIAAAPEYIADTSDQLENILKELLSL